VTPWSAQTTTQMLKAHAYLPPRPLPRVEGVPFEVAEVCGRCLAKDPADRPPAGEVAAILSGAAGAASAPRPPAPDPPTGRAAGPTAGSAGGRPTVGGGAIRPVVLAVLVAVVVAGLALASLRLFGAPSDRPGSAYPPPGVGIPVLEPPSFPASTDGSGGPGGAGPSGPGGAQDGSGAGAGVGASAGPPAGTAAGTGGGTVAPPDGPGATEKPKPGRRSVDTTGGGAVVECNGTLARLVGWSPADGYETQAIQPGPGPWVQVKFRAGNNIVSIQAGCVNGVPDVTVR